MDAFKYPSKNEMLLMIAKLNFRPFDDVDYKTWCGVETDNPLINENEEFTIVIDGNVINMLYAEDMTGGEIYSIHEGL